VTRSKICALRCQEQVQRLSAKANYYKLQVYNSATEHKQLQVVAVYCLLSNAKVYKWITRARVPNAWQPDTDGCASKPVHRDLFCCNLHVRFSSRPPFGSLVPIHFLSFLNESIPIDTHFWRHDAPSVKFHRQWRVLWPMRTHRVYRRVWHPATDTWQVRWRVPILVNQEVCAEQPPGAELQLASMAGSCQHGGQEARHSQAQCQLGVQVDE